MDPWKGDAKIGLLLTVYLKALNENRGLATRDNGIKACKYKTNEEIRQTVRLLTTHCVLLFREALSACPMIKVCIFLPSNFHRSPNSVYVRNYHNNISHIILWFTLQKYYLCTYVHGVTFLGKGKLICICTLRSGGKTGNTIGQST